MAETRWSGWAEGTECPFDMPRPESNEYWDFIVSLTVSSFYLSSNQTYRGHCLLIFDLRHAIRPDQLTSDEWQAFCADLHLAERAIMRALKPDHINVAILGNVVPHLHWIIVPRYRHDPRWEAPIWTTTLAEMHVTPMAADERAGLIQQLRTAISETTCRVTK